MAQCLDGTGVNIQDRSILLTFYIIIHKQGDDLSRRQVALATQNVNFAKKNSLSSVDKTTYSVRRLAAQASLL